MGVAVLHPQDFLKDPFSRNAFDPHMKYPRNPNSCPNKPKKSLPNNRRRRSPTRPQVRILKRGEEIAATVTDPVAVDSDLESSRRIGIDSEMMPTQIRLSDMPASFYAGSVTLTSPPPSDVPLPAFFTKKSVSMFKADDVTNDLIRILRLEI
ncbi:PREDICTED: uncharacterized protein LOC104804502 [Tarenaya hassleriana]|uniref:uncharacterized protein LOC104804502 n=1 Tax=Tarenaya hassleriana TaxID=28532 RepID=UPI00053CA1CF|nr:PREDICTED: uncharacterized protein LOC104804502 [Tarenaya hassleriana]